MHLWEQQLYNCIISHLNKLPGFCCHCVYIHSDYYPGEAPFKQWGGPKKKNDDKNDEKKTKPNISRKDQNQNQWNF